MSHNNKTWLQRREPVLWHAYILNKQASNLKKQADDLYEQALLCKQQRLLVQEIDNDELTLAFIQYLKSLEEKTQTLSKQNIALEQQKLVIRKLNEKLLSEP